MNILVIGSGGREHALCWKIAASPLVARLFCAPGNAGIAHVAQTVNLASHESIVDFCVRENIHLVVVGPETPLVDGLADTLVTHNILVFGASAKAAQLEGSKGFTKDICRKYAIPTADYARFDDKAAALDYLAAHPAPIVIKADGLAAGKGVVVAMTNAQAMDAVNGIMDGKFGDAGASVVIEAFMEGEEASFFALCDGETAVEFGVAQDHKRAFDGDKGPNTGGMGTYTPAPVMTQEMRDHAMRDIIHPTMRAMKAEGMPFSGVLFAGLMITSDGPQLIEYNVRFGDPETQSLMMQLESDLVPLLLACAKGELGTPDIRFKPGASLCVVMAANGYPGNYNKGSIINGLQEAEAVEGVTIFHAGTALQDGQWVATGGRVLGITAYGDTVEQAQARAYKAVDMIDWSEGFCRRDIGHRAVTS